MREREKEREGGREVESDRMVDRRGCVYVGKRERERERESEMVLVVVVGFSMQRQEMT